MPSAATSKTADPTADETVLILAVMECRTPAACFEPRSQTPTRPSLSHPIKTRSLTPLPHTRPPAMVLSKQASPTSPAVPAPMAPACTQLKTSGLAGSRAYRSTPEYLSMYNSNTSDPPLLLLNSATKEIAL